MNPKQIIIPFAIALSATSAMSHEVKQSKNCNQVILGATKLSSLKKAVALFVGRNEQDAREQFSVVNGLHFSFLERVSGQSNLLYDLFSVNDGENRIFVALALTNNTVQDFHIRSYTISDFDFSTAPAIPASCFLDPKGYFKFVRRKLPPETASIGGSFEFSELSGLFLHRETIRDGKGELIFLQKPFPLGSFEADIGTNTSPNIPNGFCVIFDVNAQRVLGFKMPYQCDVDMALLARQFDEELREGN